MWYPKSKIIEKATYLYFQNIFLLLVKCYAAIKWYFTLNLTLDDAYNTRNTSWVNDTHKKTNFSLMLTSWTLLWHVRQAYLEFKRLLMFSFSVRIISRCFHWIVIHSFKIADTSNIFYNVSCNVVLLLSINLRKNTEIHPMTRT